MNTHKEASLSRLCNNIRLFESFMFSVLGNNSKFLSQYEVTLGTGKYTVSETAAFAGFQFTFSGNCVQDDDNPSATGNINAGETQHCQVVNTLLHSEPTRNAALPKLSLDKY